jgi:phosphatidylserine/phosphatidylglycerophosphate/cardiolipin synthase-like enzyme
MGIGGISGGNSLQLITRGDDFFDAVISAIDSPERV